MYMYKLFNNRFCAEQHMYWFYNDVWFLDVQQLTLFNFYSSRNASLSISRVVSGRKLDLVCNFEGQK